MLFFAAIKFAQASAQFVVPGNLANVEGNSSMAEPFNSTTFRFQQVFDASQFAFVGGATARIDSISFRIDGASTNNVILFFGGGSAVLSTTQKSPDALSATFADNPGPDAVTIWSGAFSFGGDPVPGGPPYPLIETFQGTTPFFYVPSRGNLLLDIAAAGGRAFLPGSLDAQLTVGDSVSRVFSVDGNSSSGVSDSLGLITSFEITVIPEPRDLTLWLSGAIIIAVSSWRSRRALTVHFTHKPANVAE